MKKKKVIRIFTTSLVLIAALAVIGYVLTNNKRKNLEKTAVVSQSSGDVSVRIVAAVRQSLGNNFAVNGNFAPYQQMDFAAENSGRVTRVLVKEGSRVSVGQTLAIVETDQLSIDAESAQANYLNAMKDLQRYENAFRTGGVTQQQLDQARLAVDNSKARVDQARIRIGDANIRATISGVINRKYIEPGAVVSPGTRLFEIVDVSRLKLNVTVNESQVATIKTGDKVNILVSVFPDKRFSGKVSFIAAKADASLNFPVEIEVTSNPGNILRAGMYGTAMFEFPNQKETIVVPRSAFVGSVSNNEIFVVENGNTARLKNVIAGRILGDKVEIIGGINEGESVITSGQINLVDGSKITPLKN